MVTPVAKHAISIRLDQDVLEFFRAMGPRYQSQITAVLRSYVEHVTSTAPSRRKRAVKQRAAADGARREARSARSLSERHSRLDAVRTRAPLRRDAADPVEVLARLDVDRRIDGG